MFQFWSSFFFLTGGKMVGGVGWLNKARCGDSDWHRSASIIKSGMGEVLTGGDQVVTATGTLQLPP